MTGTLGTWSHVLKLVPPEEWVRRIDLIQDNKVRAKVASIVWWDFFGDRPSGHLRNFFDHCLSQWVLDDEASSNDTAAGLVAVGYPVEAAAYRVEEVSRVHDEDGEQTTEGTGEIALLFGIAVRAVNDYKALRDKRIIVGEGVVAGGWPSNRANVVGYRTKGDVEHLIDWIKGGSLKELCHELGCGLNMTMVGKQLGFTVEPDEQESCDEDIDDVA